MAAGGNTTLFDTPHNARENVHRGLPREINSTTDARARVDIAARRPSQRRLLARAYVVPVALLISDLVALAVQSAVLGGSWTSIVVFAALFLLSRAALRHYRPRLSLSVLDDVPRLLGSAVVGVGLTVLAMAATGAGDLAAVMVLRRAGLFLAVALVLQTVVVSFVRRTRARRGTGRRTLVVGGGRVASTLVGALAEHPELGLSPVGIVDPRTPDTYSQAQSGDMSRLADAVVTHDIDTTILALEDGDAHVDTVIALHQTGCEIFLVPPMFEMHHDGPDVERVRGIPMIRLRPDPTLRISWWVKRSFDVLVGALGLILLAAPLGVVALLVLIDSGRPILFWQERVGLDGRTFRLCKFRSMRPRSELESQTQWNIAEDPRVSGIGKLLRRSSVDEIPQLWNILRGQMSLVGPRPERPTFVEQFSAEHERYWARHRVPVGLTGLAQVNGLRGDTSIPERARYDNYYIANWSLWLDVKIMMLTAREVFGGRGR